MNEYELVNKELCDSIEKLIKDGILIMTIDMSANPDNRFGRCVKLELSDKFKINT